MYENGFFYYHCSHNRTWDNGDGDGDAYHGTGLATSSPPEMEPWKLVMKRDCYESCLAHEIEIDEHQAANLLGTVQYLHSYVAS